MTLPNLFSRRKRQAAAQGAEDVYQYDVLPQKLRIQITQIWDEAIGWENSDNQSGLNAADWMVRTLRKEKGVYALTDNSDFQTKREELLDWFVNEKNSDLCMDAIEMLFRIIDKIVRKKQQIYASYVRSEADEAIDEINARFLEAGVGYQYERDAGEMIRLDSQFVHSEVVKPLLALLTDSDFGSVNKEFREAHRLYRHGDNEQALTECGKAFESVLKVIAGKRGWPVAPNATSKPLLDAVFDNGLVPEYLKGEFTALRSLLESGVPTIRNKSGGHGAGAVLRSVPAHLVAFQLHQTAAAILFLVEAHKALP